MSAAREYEPASDYEWPRPPVGGWAADDLDELPNLPPHTELIDGSLVFVSPQTRFHSLVMRLLENSLLQSYHDMFEPIWDKRERGAVPFLPFLNPYHGVYIMKKK